MRYCDSPFHFARRTSREVVVNVKSTPSGNGWTQFTPSPDTRINYDSKRP